MNLNELIPVGVTIKEVCSADNYNDWFEQLRPQEVFLIEKCEFNRKPGTTGYSTSVYSNEGNEYHVLMVIHTTDANAERVWDGAMNWEIKNVGKRASLHEAMQLAIDTMKAYFPNERATDNDGIPV